MSKALNIFLAVAASLVSVHTPTALAVDEAPIQATIAIDAGNTLRKMDPRRLGGTNVAMWYYPSVYAAPIVREWLAEMRPGEIRMPGGSWANVVYWNGHGVRAPDGSVDTSKIGPDGYPAVDYSDYARSFLADPKTLHPASGGWHGHTDVKTQHEFIKAIPGTDAMVCPNIGTGRPVDAAEWVRWANLKMGHKIKHWELGNELGGAWEPGNDLPFGKGRITAEMYTKRYNDTAKAMRAVDPSIKIGGGAFAEEMLRDCGDNVDFVHIHTYPGSATQTEAQLFADIGPGIQKQVEEVRNWIHKHQPQRREQIEIAYTEWNMGFSLKAEESYAGLWACIFLGELAKAGVDMAHQWDCFDGLLETSEVKGYVRRPEYYALWLWNNYMGERLLPATADDKSIYTYSSRSDDAVSVLLVNTNRERGAKLKVHIDGFTPADFGELATLTSREYHFNPQLRKAQWSTGARIERLATGETFDVELAPFSMTCVRVPSKSRPELTPMAQKAIAAAKPSGQIPEIRFIMSPEVYVGDDVQTDLIALAAGTDGPYQGTLPPAELSASAAVTFDRSAVRINNAVGRFTFTASEPGDFAINARSGDAVATRLVRVKPSIPRPIVFWDFDNPPVTDQETFSSSYKLSADLTQRANRAVARVDLAGQVAVGHQDTGLFAVKKLPGEDKLNKANIRGVIVDLMTSTDLTCDDPNAHIMVVMQSSANWWMHLGSIPLKAGMDWKSYQFDIQNEDHIKAMPPAHNVLFVLQSNKPVKGSIYFDKIGFMVR